MNRTKFAWSAVAIIMLVSIAWYATRPSGTPSASVPLDAKVSVRLKWVFDPGFAGEMVAAKAGFFQKHGLNVELQPGGFESDPVRMVAAGADQFGVAGADSFLLARAKGLPLVAIAAGYLQTPVVFYVNADSKIKTPEDFKGMRIGYQAGQDTGTVYEALLAKVGLKKSDVHEIPVKYDFSPFLTGQVDVWPGYAASQSFVLEREKRPYRVITPADFGINYLGTVYFTTEDFAQKNPEIVRNFVAAVIEGWQLTYADYSRAIPLISEYDPKNLSSDMVRFTLDKQKPVILPEGRRFAEYRKEDWVMTQKALLDQKLLPNVIDLDRAVRYDFLTSFYSGR